MNNLPTQRSELKYMISTHEYLALMARLQNILPADKNSELGKGYFVRSLYFDSHFDKSLRDKKIGALIRKKYRLRLYDLSATEVKFEIKHKINRQVSKEIVVISKELANQVIQGDYRGLLNSDNKILQRIYAEFTLGNYRPKLIVDYQREAFELNIFNIRITIDNNIRINNSNFDIFVKSLPTIPIIGHGWHILEIKFDQVLPGYIKHALQIKSFVKTNFSKYATGRKF